MTALRVLIGCETSGVMRRSGKKAAGRMLDGRTWNEMPTPTTTEGRSDA